MALTILSQASLSKCEEYLYPDLILTSYALKDIGDGKVEWKVSDGSGDKATFLTNIKKTGGGWFRPDKFEGKKLTIGQAKEVLKEDSRKPLFCIHGFSVAPEGQMKDCKESQKNFKDTLKAIPVIWPSDGADYFDQRDESVEAAEAFQRIVEEFEKIKEELKSFPAKSVMAHSMGNRVLRFAAIATLKFDNIFMVAGDVPYDLFHADYEERNKKSAEASGVAICSMLSNGIFKKKGKVHVLFNEGDLALTSSAIVKEARLGKTGAGTEEELDNRVKGLVESRDCTDDISRMWRFSIGHSYQFEEFACKYYEDQYNSSNDANS